MNNNEHISFAFFGTGELSTIVLDELEKEKLIPKLIICAEDKPVGRKMIITPPEAKVWAQKRNIPVFQPKTLREEKEPGITEKIKNLLPHADLLIVASYGKIIPQAILDIPKHGTLNVHPSLLPKLRGPSPIQSAILSENETGVTIMLLDAEMDHGPILAQEKTEVPEWPPYKQELKHLAGHQGGRMLAEIIPLWLAGKITPKEQNHTDATICKKIKKEDGLLDFSLPAEENLRKIRAFQGWPHAYFFLTNREHCREGMEETYTPIQKRIIVTRAHIENDTLIIDRVIPEGKKEMSYADFKRGNH